MTEDEAKTKWCPFVRIVTGKINAAANSSEHRDQPPYNRVVDGAAYSYPMGGGCIASSCMAWRQDRAIKSGDGFIRHGFCGLAGRPE